MKLARNIAATLQQSRPITQQVRQLLADRWEIVPEADAVAAFFAGTFPNLDEFEQEDLLAPLFTPGFEEKHLITPLLHQEEKTSQAGWLSQLLGEVISLKPTSGLELEDGEVLEVSIPESVIERYVVLLELDRKPGEQLTLRIRSRYPNQAGDRILTRLRERAWRSESARDLLGRWLDLNAEISPTVEELDFLTEWLGGHPLNILDFPTLARNLTEWCEAYQNDHCPFFNDLIGTVDKAAQDRSAGMLVQTKHVHQPKERLELASKLAERLGELSMEVSAN